MSHAETSPPNKTKKQAAPSPSLPVANFFSKERLTRLGFVIAGSLCFTLALAFFNDTERTSMLRSGDFPGFFVQGEIIIRGQFERLYDPHLQREIQNQYWPSFAGEFYMAAYPPFVAIAMAPLAWLGPSIGQLVFTLFMLLCFCLTLVLLQDLNHTLKGRILGIGGMCLLFTPLFAGIFAAQNTALSMLLCTVLLRYVAGSPYTFASGLVAAFWLYKPQFGLLATVAAFWLRRDTGFLRGFLFGALFLYLLGAVALGPLGSGVLWPFEWLSVAQSFGAENYAANSRNMVSVAGAAMKLHSAAGLTREHAALLGTIVSVCLVVGLAIVLRKRTIPHEARFVIFIALLPILSPQTLFYDLGITLVSLLRVFSAHRDRSFLALSGLVLLSFAAFELRGETVLPSFFYIGLSMAVWIVTEVTLLKRNSFSV